jgi:DNA-binding transcriptional LysR family regulator
MDHQLELVGDLNQLKAGRDRLRLAVTQSIGEHLLPELLLAFSDAFPDYRIDSRVGYSRSIHTRLATGLADLALTEIQPDHPDVLVQKWLDDELVMVCSPGHALGTREMLAVAEIPELTYVLRERESSMRITLDRTLADIGISELPVAMEVGSTDTIVEMLERGRHVSFLPRFAVRGAIDAGELHLIRIEGLRIMRTLWIARTRANLDNPVAEAFIGLLRERLPIG